MSAQHIEGQRKDKLKHAKLTEITVGERFRKEFGDLDELVESIQRKGIIQPLSVDKNGNLLAGGRRFAAAERAGLLTVPVIVREIVDTLDSREIELFENIHRKDFTWAERAAITAEINALYQQKNGKTWEGWSGRKTAELLDRSVAQVSRELQLAAAIKIMPELGELKTADEALKVLKKLEGDAIVEELRERQKKKMAEHTEEVPVEDGAAPATAVSAMEKGLRTMLHLAEANYQIKDAFKGLAALKDNGPIQIIECDPPYGIDLNEQKGSKSSTVNNVDSYDEVPAEKYERFVNQLASELFRVAGKDCWLVFWYGPTWHQTVLTALRNAGWQVDEIPAIWTKAHGQTLQPELYFARCYEPFFLCRKGKPVLVERGRSNVFSFPAVPSKSKFHPTQRPVELIKEVLHTLGAGRQQVLVPFLGSGATLLACYELGMHGFGFDRNKEYKDKFMLEVEAQTRRLFEPEE